MERSVFLGQPRYCVCTNASRGLSVTSEFLVSIISVTRMRDATPQRELTEEL